MGGIWFRCWWTKAKENCIRGFILVRCSAQSLTLQIDHELARYRNGIPIPLKDSPTNWWRKKSSQYPLLGKLVQCYFAIPGTSVHSERVFSTAGDVVTALRTSLKTQSSGYVGISKQKLRTLVHEVIWGWWSCNLDNTVKSIFSSFLVISFVFSHRFIYNF